MTCTCKIKLTFPDNTIKLSSGSGLYPIVLRIKDYQRVVVYGDADLMEIVPETPYTAPDLDWTDNHSRNVIEAHDAASRPAIKDLPDLSAYDEIWLGYPIWWYTAPRIIFTAVEKLPAHVTVHPFATSGGSTIARSVKDLQATASPTITWTPGKMM